MPKYVSDVTLDCDSNNFYWSNRLIGCLADSNYGTAIQAIERYQAAIFNEGTKLINEYDKKFIESKDAKLIAEANEKLCNMAKGITTDTLNKVLLNASAHMKNGYSRSDN